ncbi:hypothetical protein SO694_00119054 [Aureococcus anophagefferens]|uniref:Uncharacterized protein n=1 Tax=Aureococcus anophagefferens TaxID=44056 RepID=A0ABR1FWA0_AURAN
MHAILALAVGAAAFGSSSSATSSEDLESIEATLDHVEEMRRRARGRTRRSTTARSATPSPLFDDGESYSATVTEVTGSDITVTYSDDDTSTYDLTESGNGCRPRAARTASTTCDSSTLDTEVWGNQWWNDPYASQSYINFKVFSTGDVHFKPDNAERTVYINEQVEYEYETDVDRRLSTAEAVLGDIDLTLPIDHALARRGAVPPQQHARGGSQKPAAASEVPSPKGEPVALKDAPVFSTGDVHFKPDNAERTVYINEQVEYEYETDVDRRLSTAEAVLGDIDLTLPIDHARLVEARYRHSDTRGGSQKARGRLGGPEPEGRARRAERRETQGGPTAG